MGFLSGNGLNRYPQEYKDKEARRRKKLERQEKRVERLNEPIFAWLCKTFRVVTVGATIIMGGLEVRNSMAVQAGNLTERVLFTALGAWMVFGLIWLIGAVGQMFTLYKAGEAGSKSFRSYRNNVIVIVVVAVILLVAFMLI